MRPAPLLAPLLALLLTFAAPAAQAQTPSPPAPETLRLVWADEFEADGPPDPARWTFDTHANPTGWYNNEAQYYSAARPENARIENGLLILEARRETLDPARFPDHGGQNYTSARMVSRGAGWTYGVFEVRARIPCGRGTWPAIWMLPVALESWPGDGEIDIMEHVGHRPGVVHGTVHTGAYNHVAKTQRGAEIAVPDACDAFHRYQVRWTPEAVVFALDDVDYHRFDNEHTGKPAWPFDQPFQLILNIAVGGDWGGAEGIDDAVFPQRMEVDWVRVWQVE
ncbi:glycoside hydrolase family 16 protein [Brevundimonas sp.]|uniref:glycoside hydrolase family 16 protein n=1 Tax=Brevundimonas sp. TaxID=1871086 RepID=UPI002737CC85|nr:glycoside hydrolase family 16 protein [Brevundimonas sp.]MDP3801402.1 glycoside hydrolase family 16 protein [Brevundimonas sp.]